MKLLLSSFLVIVGTALLGSEAAVAEVVTAVPRLREIDRPATTVKEWLSQTPPPPQAPIQVTGVRLNPTDAGLEIILQTASSTGLKTTQSVEGTTLTIDIPNAVLALPNQRSFQADTTTATVTATQLAGNRIQVQIVGKTALPTATVIAQPSPVAQPPDVDEEEITVTGDRQPAYRAPSSGTATGTNIPILETPFSIQVIPQQVLRDQQVTRIEEAVRNVSGIAASGDAGGRRAELSIRGFQTAPVLRDGFRRYGSFQAIPEIANLEQVEVIKGPASILYGEIQPGGVINLVSKQPLSQPFYEAEVQGGSPGLFRPRFDISGPLSPDRRLLYRLNGVYQTAEGFRGFDQNDRRISIAPTLTWKVNDLTDFGVSLEYIDINRAADFGLPVIGRSVVDVPRDRISNDPSDVINTQYLSFGYNIEHRFSPSWKLRNAFRSSSYDYDFNTVALPLGFNGATATVRRVFGSQEGQNENLSLQTNVLGEFATGSIGHTLLFGVDLNRSKDRIFSIGDFITGIPLNIFNPVYVPKLSEAAQPPFGGNNITTNRLGVYLQDQISLFNNLKLLAGIRYDTVEQRNERIPGLFTSPGETTQEDSAFTPRFGLLYQPSKTISLYGSYSRSFNPNSATTSAGDVLEPEEGEGYEFGIKSELLNGRLFATLTYFNITKQNVAVADPNSPLFSVASGEQRSRGIEFDLTGELAPGWNLIASYAYIDAEITQDSNPSLVGNRLFGTPEHSASLWTTYEIQRGNLQGLGFGVGFNYVGERAGDLSNSFEAESYFLTNAAIFYRRNNWRFALNFRNLGNVKYIESTTNSRSSGNFFGEPFTVIGSVSVQF